jgi:4-amino-4-deoxy-L-arabinose transferase-like glycosyltransferase
MSFINFKNFKNLPLILIVVIAIILRFWQLGNVPPSPNWDEAALGYNAYSIMTTGRDEYGKFLPVILRSFDDYKPGLYAYLIIPFIKLLDLNTVAVRLPSAIFGVLAVIGTYLLVKELFQVRGPAAPHPHQMSSRSLRALDGGPPLRVTPHLLALLAAFLLAISPWHLQFSRVAFEAQVGLSLNIFSVLFFIKGLKRGIYLIPSVMLAALSIYVYQGEKVYVPILFMALIIIYWKDLVKVPKAWIAGSVLAGILFSIPMLIALISDPNSLMRARGVSIFADQTQFLQRNVIKYADSLERGDIIGMIVDNRRLEYAKAVVAGYISHFNLNWLFVTGDIERHHAPNMALLYLFELPFLLIGIYLLVFGNFSKKTKLTIFAILLIAPIPASVTSGVPHAVRTINFLPTFQIFVALGLIAAVIGIANIKYKIAKIHIKYPIFALFFLFFILNFSYYLNQYFVQQNYYYSEYWQYGWRQAVDYIKPIKDKYNKVVVSNDRPLDQSYMFFLYHLKYDPNRYLNEGGTRTGGFKEEHRFGNFEFRIIDWDKEEKDNLYVGRPDDFPQGARVLETISYLNGKPAILIVEKK